MEIWQLKYFIQICKDKSFSKAAKNLHISQQALSKAIKKLEDELKFSVFYRSTKGTELTEVGNLLLEKSQKVIKEFDLMTSYFYDKVNSNKGTISLGVTPIIYNSILAPIVWEFQDENPNINFEILQGEQHECEMKVKNNIIDMACIMQSVDKGEFKFIPIGSWEMILLVNKDNPLSKKLSVKLKDLENEKFIMISSSSKAHKLIIDSCLNAGFQPNIAFSASQPELIAELVTLNKGINICPNLFSLRSSIKNNDKVSIVKIDDIPFKWKVGFIVNKNQNINFIANRLIEHTKKYIEDNSDLYIVPQR